MAGAQYDYDSGGRLKSKLYDDIYFSDSGAEEESEHVFLCGNKLSERFSSVRKFVVAEAGFGTGLNFLKTMQLWEQSCTAGQELVYIGFEADPLPPEVLREVQAGWRRVEEFSKLFLEQYTVSPATDCRYSFDACNVRLLLYVGDINLGIERCTENIDAWFLDGFSPAKNPAMWSADLFRKMAARSSRGATFATYSCARAVREGLVESGFSIEKIAGFGKKKFMLRGMLR